MQLETWLGEIEKRIHKEPNWVKDAMNTALISIGSVDKKLNAKALLSAKKIGKVEVEYGDTSCLTPDALEQLTSERVQKKLV